MFLDILPPPGQYDGCASQSCCGKLFVISAVFRPQAHVNAAGPNTCCCDCNRVTMLNCYSMFLDISLPPGQYDGRASQSCCGALFVISAVSRPQAHVNAADSNTCRCGCNCVTILCFRRCSVSTKHGLARMFWSGLPSSSARNLG